MQKSMIVRIAVSNKVPSFLNSFISVLHSPVKVSEEN